MTGSYKSELDKLLGEARQAENETAALYKMISTYPGLAWVKRYDEETNDYYMIALSERYVYELIGPERLASYRGRTDSDFWPPAIASVFRNNDDKARREKTPQYVEEFFTSPRTNKGATFKGWKWSFTVAGETYVAGVGVDVDV